MCRCNDTTQRKTRDAALRPAPAVLAAAALPLLPPSFACDLRSRSTCRRARCTSCTCTPDIWSCKRGADIDMLRCARGVYMCMCTHARAHENAQHARHLACERRTAAPMTVAVRSTRSTRFMQRGASSRAAILAAGRAHVPRRPAGCCSRPATSSSRCARRLELGGSHRLHTC